jgi:hypothetical protein
MSLQQHRWGIDVVVCARARILPLTSLPPVLYLMSCREGTDGLVKIAR